jgi:large subunit ribosomal protein L23
MSDKQVANEERLLKVILGPHVSEKSSIQTEQNNQYVFKVVKDATKSEIRRAIEHLFNVNVLGVTTSNLKGKLKRFGQRLGRHNDTKKAYVRLKEGQSIDFMGKELGA